MIQLNYAGFGYCQTPDDLQYRSNTRTATTEVSPNMISSFC